MSPSDSSPRQDDDSKSQPFKATSLRGLLTTAKRSQIMASVKRNGTAAELVVRRLVRGLGIRFTTDNRDLPGSPDLANRTKRLAIFVHGCYWHRHQGCRRTTTPARNRAFWQEKFDANVRRDRRVLRQLRLAGYRVLVVWECRTRDEATLEKRLSRRLHAWASPGRRPPGR